MNDPKKIIAVIPARMGSSRFPGKPLAKILGRPMIEHVYRRTAMCQRLAGVVVATCDQEIYDAVYAFGGHAVMTADTHERASDRVAEAIEEMDTDIVVMVQGDEPMIFPEMIDAALNPFFDEEGICCVNLAARIQNQSEFEDPNTIKVVMDTNGIALFMSREPIPTSRQQSFDHIHAYKQVCVIPFTAQGLQVFTRLEPTRLEIAESIDMLRFLEHGIRVKMVETTYATQAVDTPSDLEKVEILMGTDPLVSQYMQA
ncbi:MAG: 3-deoxy-manno-octulosonate cytidylyltransferase [Desulfobacterales bacterium]|nr:3-deoxy-manno-octulosonate cytidylyltransferase [Desulfobacterales bacterium]